MTKDQATTLCDLLTKRKLKDLIYNVAEVLEQNDFIVIQTRFTHDGVIRTIITNPRFDPSFGAERTGL